MLMFVSDIHLTDQTLAPPVPLEALGKFVEYVKKTAPTADRIEIVLLGDIFDVLRSCYWLVRISQEDFVPAEIRPWDSIDYPVERVVKTILNGIKAKYKPFFDSLNNINKVTITWIPGNHDRLVGITQAGEEFLRDIGVQKGENDIIGDQYGVYACHGHRFDELNFQEKYDFPSYGDGIVVELLNKLQVEAAKKCKIVNFNHGDIKFLTAIEYVHPPLQALKWIVERIGAVSEQVLKFRIKTAWSKVLTDFKNSEIFAALSSNKFLQEKFISLITSLGDYSQYISVLGIFGDFESAPRKQTDKFVKYLRKEKPHIKYLVTGHTHNPGIEPMHGLSYVNTGWWARRYDYPQEPRMSGFNVVTIRHKTDKPQLADILCPLAMDWEYPIQIGIPPAHTFQQAFAAPSPIEKHAFAEQGLIDLFTETSGLRVAKLVNATKNGFDMVIQNKIKKQKLGKNIGIEIKDSVNIHDIYKLDQNIGKAGYDKGWIFTFGPVKEDVKHTALNRNIKIFDLNESDAFHSGKAFEFKLI